MPSSDSSRDVLLEQLAAEFVERHRRGEHPPLSEYTSRYPDLAADIRDLFPALVQIECLKPTDATGAFEPAAAGSTGVRMDRLGDYRILREVGRGGMGVVYEAEQESLGRHVALKVLPASALLNPTYLERFRREARAAAKLHHTNIVPVFGTGEAGGVHFYAMQFIQGEGLDSVMADVRRLRRQPGEAEPGALSERSIAQSLLSGQFAAPDAPTEPLPRPAVPASGLSVSSPEAEYCRGVARLGVQAADALAYAHKQGILHRDVKPSNLLLDLQGTVWVTDFGLAKAEGTDELTQTGDIVGTLRFMSPERFEGKSLPQSDVYALGVTLYELLTLRPAFEDNNKAKLIDKVLHETPVAPRKIDTRIPRDLETIVLKSLAKAPEERYATAEALAEDLRRFLGDRPIRARRTPWHERAWRWCRRNPVVASLLTMVVMLLLAVAAVSTFAAVRLNDALGRMQHAEGEARLREAEALVGQAHGIRYSRRAGQRFDALAAINKAAAIGRELHQSPEWFDRLRNEAVGALALPDVEVVQQWEGCPRGTVGIKFDGALERYARSDQHGNVSVRRVADDTEIVALSGSGGAADACLSPDGQLLAVHDIATGRLKVWRLTDRPPVSIHEAADVTRWGVDFSPDNQRLLYIHRDSRFSVVALADGQVTRWSARGNGAASPHFRPDGSQVIFTVRVNGQVAVTVCDARTGAVVANLPHPATVTWYDWHPAGRWIATCCDDHRLRLWDTTTWQIDPGLDAHLGRNGGTCAFTADGQYLLGNDWDCLMRVWDVRSGRQVFATPMSYSIDRMCRDGRLPLFQGEGNPVKLIRVLTGREFRTLPRRAAPGRGGYRAPVASAGVALSPESRLLAAITAEHTCALVEPESGVELAVIPLKMVQSLAFDTSGALLIHGSMGLLRWPIQVDQATRRGIFGPPEILFQFPSDGQHGNSPDARVLALPNFNRGALLLNRDRSGALVVLGPQEDVRRCAVSPDGRWVATATFSNTKSSGVKVWESPGGRLVKDLPRTGGSSVGFSPDGKWLVTTNQGCQLWAVGSWDQGPFIGKESAFAFSPDGRMLAVADSSVIRLVNPATGRAHVRLDAPESGRLWPSCFTGDGSRLIALNNDSQALYVWDLRLIRQQLAEMGLDWDAPPYPETPRASPVPLEIRVVGAELVGRDPLALNNQAWLLVTGSARQRDPAKALELIQQAVKLQPKNAHFLNTFGVVQYRNGRFKEAAGTLEKSLAAGKGASDALDLFFLAMCHAKLGDRTRAKDCFDRAVQWWNRQKDLTAHQIEELKAFRAEAEGVMRNEQPRK